MPAVLLLAASLSACKIEKTVVGGTGGDAAAVAIGTSFDPDRMADADWDAKVLPMLREKAGAYDEVASAIDGNADAAGQRFGYRAEATSPWTYAVRVDGTIAGAATESRAATIDVKTPGGRTVTLQIGPVVRGTAIRDMLASRPFGSFKNQVDYAQYGRALNVKANASALSKVPRQDLIGRKVTATGVVQPASPGGTPLVTPVEITVGSKP